MTPDRLLSLFDRISDAPDAIPRLRRFILDLAVRRRLVDSIGEGTDMTLGDLGTWGSGGTPIKTHPEYYGGLIPWLVIGDLNDGLVTRAATTITEAGLLNSSAKLVEAGTVLIAMYGSIGKLGITGLRCATNQAIAFCVPNESKVTRDFLVVVLKSLREALLAKGQGVAQQNISQQILKAHPVNLPPIEEQRRIVARVDELMALCDQLEAAQVAREAQRNRVAAASLQRLNEPADDLADFREHVSFHLSNLPRLVTRPEHLPALRQTILNLAVRGKLVPQDPNDEPATVALARAARSGDRSESDGRGRDWLTGADGSPSEAFAAPAGWAWTRIANAVERVTVGFVGTMKAHYVNDGIPFLRSQNVRANRFRSEGLIHISPSFHQTISKSALAPGDVVVVRSGNVGTSCVIPDSLPEANCSDLVVVKQPKAVIPDFLCFYLNSLAAAHIGAGTVGIALTHFNTKSVALMPLPLPPLAEQSRIVNKVNELLAVCDELGRALARARDESRGLLEAVLHEALVPAAHEPELTLA